MKRFAILLLLVVLLCSCAPSSDGPSDDPFSFVHFPMTVEAAVDCEAGQGRVSVSFTDAQHYTVCFSEPEIMRGVTYEADGEKAYLTFGQSRVPVTDGQACIAALALARLFIPDYTVCTARQEATVDGMNAQICKIESGTLTGALYFSGADTPYRIEGSADGFRATFTDLNFS